MLLSSSRSGLMVLIVIGAAIYFSGAWPWLGEKVKTLNGSCYTMLSSAGANVAEPVCTTLAKAIDYSGKLVDMAGDKLTGLGDRLGMSDSVAVLDRYTSELMGKAAGLRSTQEQLAQLIEAGPSNLTAESLQQQFQQAVDSFAIGQSYLRDGGSAEHALPWLKAGAAAPQGFGLLSQISLAQLYASGTHGVPQDNDYAQTYLKQASSSISTLQSNGSPQAQQLLRSLPVSPQEMQTQIQRAVKQIQLNVH